MLRKAKNIAHLILAFAAATINGYPGRKLVVTGITGTDGKTTTSSLLYEILRKSGKKTAVISTIGAVIDGKNYDTGFHVTTPSPFAIQKYLKLALQEGCTHAVLEVTSHALDQQRVWGINFEIGVLTNITHEHLDYHKSYKHYVSTKLLLLKRAKWAVVNTNGEWYDYVKKAIQKNKIIPFSLHGAQSGDLTIINVPYKISTVLIGDFNLENILAATAAALKLGVKPQDIAEAVENFRPPVGRQEVVVRKDFDVIVDFAHTANSFENVLSEVRKKTQGRLIHVFGAAGERDRSKRKEMGKAASFYDDIIILTAEDPRSERVEEINKNIIGGMSGFTKKSVDEKPVNKAFYEILDRKDAIFFALSLAEPHDTIIITGKGHERSMNYGKGEIPWSDQETVKEYFKSKK